MTQMDADEAERVKATADGDGHPQITQMDAEGGWGNDKLWTVVVPFDRKSKIANRK